MRKKGRQSVTWTSDYGLRLLPFSVYFQSSDPWLAVEVAREEEPLVPTHTHTHTHTQGLLCPQCQRLVND